MISLTAAFEAHQGYLLGVAYGMTGSRVEAEDLVSVLWIRVIPRWELIDDQNLRGMFWRILANLNTDRLRMQWAVSIDTVPEWADDGRPYSDYMADPVSIDAIVEGRERFERVKAVLRTLSEPEQRAVASAAWGQTHQPNAQRIALHRARKRLKEAV